MYNKDTLFFELVRVAIGSQEHLSHLPSTTEWDELYMMAAKQSLVGVCFAGLQRLGADADDGYAIINMSEMQYLNWMAMAFQIQQRNELVNQQCVELTNKFRIDGFDVVVLKGQSAARRYGPLALLRQSGDIDAWLTCDRDKIKKYITKNYEVGEVIYNHAHVSMFEETEVEVHFTPSWLYSPFRNKKLQKWFDGFKDPKGLSAIRFEFQEQDGFKSPSAEFDLVYLMLHSYRHLLHEGLGLRQAMDYYFTLMSTNSRELYVNCSVNSLFKQLGLTKFAGAMMYVMQEVFGLEEKYMIYEPDKARGERLLQEIMLGGNMGKGDDRTGKCKSRIGYFWEHVSRQRNFMRDYPSEVLWSPLWKTWHFVMRKSGRI